MPQPLAQLNGNGPYNWKAEGRDAQLIFIRRTMEIARAADHGQRKTTFTLFPEYSIPGIEGVELLDSFINANWPNGTVVIAGTDALSKEEYRQLVESEPAPQVAPNNGVERVQDHQWVNCCVIWIKDDSGVVKRWLQPKISPAWPEENVHHQQMFCGSSAFLFRCQFDNKTPCAFTQVVCFDWIGSDDGEKIQDQILARLQERANGYDHLNWVFVIQNNDKPNHHTFLNATSDFFVQQHKHPSVRREHACVVFANSAGSDIPGPVEAYGFSSLIFSPQCVFPLGDCPLTHTSEPKRLRKEEILGMCKDVLFRENGACIHSFSHRIPAFSQPDAAGRHPLIQTANVHSAPKGFEDPRVPARPVAGCLKWTADTLDLMKALDEQYPGAALHNDAKLAHQINRDELVGLPSRILEQRMKEGTCLTAGDGDDKWDPNCDRWRTAETGALEHMVNTLDILKLAFLLRVADSPTHGTADVRGHPVDIVTVRGQNHDDCLKHAQRVAAPRYHHRMIVSRDADNRPLLRKFGSFLQGSGPSLEKGPKFTDPSSGELQVGYPRFLEPYIAAPSLPEFAATLYAIVSA
jgi:hypothetical protein